MVAPTNMQNTARHGLDRSSNLLVQYQVAPQMLPPIAYSRRKPLRGTKSKVIM